MSTTIHHGFHPIALCSAMIISYHAFPGVPIFSAGVLVLASLAGLAMAKNLYCLPQRRLQNAFIEVVYLGVLDSIMRFLPWPAFYRSALAIAVYAVYVLVVNPRWMDRPLVTRTIQEDRPS